MAVKNNDKQNLFVDEQEEVVVDSKTVESKITAKKITNNLYTVKSIDKKGERVYSVKISGESISCNCSGFKFRRSCKHIDEVIKLIPSGRNVEIKKLENKFSFIESYKMAFKERLDILKN